jgi:hypothetical protein
MLLCNHANYLLSIAHQPELLLYEQAHMSQDGSCGNRTKPEEQQILIHFLVLMLLVKCTHVYLVSKATYLPMKMPEVLSCALA